MEGHRALIACFERFELPLFGKLLAEQSEVQVLGAQHFFVQHSFLSCSACRLLEPDGQLLGVLDISNEAAHQGGDMLGMVRLLAMTLENTLLARQLGISRTTLYRVLREAP